MTASGGLGGRRWDQAGLSATSWRTFGWAMVVVAVLVPVGPAAAEVKSDPSQVTWRLPAVDAASASSLMAVGGGIELVPPMPNIPITLSPGTVVVIEGAAIEVVAGPVTLPPRAALGEAGVGAPVVKRA